MKTFLLLFVALAAGSVSADTIYSNNTTDLANSIQYTANGYTQLGDTIALGGTARFVTQASTQFFNFDSSSTTFSATLSLYAVGTGGNVVGALLGSYTVNGVSITGFNANIAASGLTNVTFSNLNVTVPDNVIFVLSVANITSRSADLGLELYDPPTAGSSSNATFISNNGGGYVVSATDPGFGNPNFSLTTGAATPEPAGLSFIGGGLAALLLYARQKRRA
jgi:riboflavin synthase alpha subunit